MPYSPSRMTPRLQSAANRPGATAPRPAASAGEAGTLRRDRAKLGRLPRAVGGPGRDPIRAGDHRWPGRDGGPAERPAQRVRELPARPIPLFRHLGQGPGQDLIYGLGQFRPPYPHRRRRLRQLGHEHSRRALAFERRRPGQQVVSHAGQRVLVGTPVQPYVPALFRRGVIGGPQELAGAGQGDRPRCLLAHPKVRQVHVVGLARRRGQQDFAGLTSRWTRRRRARRPGPTPPGRRFRPPGLAAARLRAPAAPVGRRPGPAASR